MPSEAFSFHSIVKTFGALRANDQISFSVSRGSIHGVVGENGAGKSTIMKTLYGLYAPDSGEIRVGGKRVTFRSPHDAISQGIGMVHQHFMLVPTLTVWQNIILGEQPHGFRSNRRKSLTRLSALQEQVGIALNLEANVEDLPVGQQQQVEILKLLYRQADILILDEPTAVLTPQEVDALIVRLQRLRSQGKTVVFISHKLREILRLTDAVTILRQGKHVGTFPTKDLTESSLAQAMIGRPMRPTPSRKPLEATDNILVLENLSVETAGRKLLDGVSFSVRSGEILGVGGVDGNGQQELFEILAKTRLEYSGHISFEGQDFATVSAYPLKQKGLAVIPPDRHREGCILDFNQAENFILGHHQENAFTSAGRLRWESIRERTLEGIQRFDVRPPEPTAVFRSLSGGNQQKLVIAREFCRPVRLLLAAHPTRGVDIGAIERIHREILALRDQGAAVLLFSSELEEILALADRVTVIYNGRIQGQCSRSAADEKTLGLWMTGGTA